VTGKSYLEFLSTAGFESARLGGPTGYVTSKYTEAWYVEARKPTQ